MRTQISQMTSIEEPVDQPQPSGSETKLAESANQMTPTSISLCQNNKGIHL